MHRILNLYRDAFTNIQHNVWILSIAMFINRSGSMVLLFTSLYLTKELHFSISDAGIALSFYGVGSVLGSYVGGWLTDRKNFFDVMFFSLISSGLILFLLLIATSPFFVSLVIFLYAFASDIFRPANSKAIAAYSTISNRTRSVSLVRLAINLGFSIGPAIGGFVALYLGYKWLFVIDACTSFVAAFMLFIYLPRKNDEHKNSNSTILDDKKTSAYRDGSYLFFILLVALYGVSFFQLFASIPQYFDTVCNYNEGTIGLLLALNGFLVVVIELPLVTFLEKNQQIFRFIIIGTSCVALSFLALVFGNGMIVFAIIYTIIITFSEIFAMPFMMNYALSKGKKERQGQYSALYSISYGFANIVAPLVGLGIANKYGFNSMFYFFILISVVASIGFAFLAKKEKTKQSI